MLCPLRFYGCSSDYISRNRGDFECFKDSCAWFVFEAPKSLDDLEGPQVGSCAIPNLVDGKGVRLEEAGA